MSDNPMSEQGGQILGTPAGVGKLPGWQKLPLVLLPALAVLINWPYLFAGFQADDYIFINVLNEGIPFSRWRGFWSIPDPPCFTNLWWLEEGFARGFWRPLPSLVFEGSLRLFGHAVDRGLRMTHLERPRSPTTSCGIRKIVAV